MSTDTSEPAAIPRPDVTLPPPMAPEAPLYSPNQILVGALLGTPVAAAVMWRANLVALGRPRPWLALAAGFAATGVLVAVNLAVSAHLGFIPVVLAMALRQPANLAFTPALLAAGGRHSWPRAIGVTIATTLAFLFAVVAGVMAVGGGLAAFDPPEVHASQNEIVQFDDEKDRPDAEQLARALTEIGVFDGRGSDTVSMSKPREGGFGVLVRFPASVTRESQRAWVDFVAQNASRVLHQCVLARTVDDDAFDPKPLEEKRVCP